MNISEVLLLITICCSASGAKTYQKDALKVHNNLRSKHGSPSLKMDEKLNLQALRCTEEYLKGKAAHQCAYILEFDDGENFGSASASNGAPSIEQFGLQTIHDWYDEIRFYDFDQGTSFGNNVTGHFSQLVWKESTSLGYACSSKLNQTTCVAIYVPGGNVQGEYVKNVRPKLKK